jgi:hypothetical protein
MVWPGEWQRLGNRQGLLQSIVMSKERLLAEDVAI